MLCGPHIENSFASTQWVRNFDIPLSHHIQQHRFLCHLAVLKWSLRGRSSLKHLVCAVTCTKKIRRAVDAEFGGALVELMPAASTAHSAEWVGGNLQSSGMKSNQSGLCIDLYCAAEQALAVAACCIVFLCVTSKEHCRFEINYIRTTLNEYQTVSLISLNFACFAESWFWHEGFVSSSANLVWPK